MVDGDARRGGRVAGGEPADRGALAAGLVAWEFAIARTRNRADCFRAFLHNNWLGAAVFAGIVASYALEG